MTKETQSNFRNLAIIIKLNDPEEMKLNSKMKSLNNTKEFNMELHYYIQFNSRPFWKV